jgi:hypothetical protein
LQAISDKALAVLAFAIYHELESGARVSHVIKDDGAGHRASPEGVEELERLGLANSEADRIAFTKQGESVLDTLLSAMRQAAPR